MTKSLSVLNNIDLIEKQIKQFEKQKKEIEKELLRLEGSQRVFEQFKSVGIETIALPEDIVENTEVIDTEDVIHSCESGPDNSRPEN
jgi:cell division protein FtsL